MKLQHGGTDEWYSIISARESIWAVVDRSIRRCSWEGWPGPGPVFRFRVRYVGSPAAEDYWFPVGGG
jgi:hypothetical protein